jgi:hypothetical protein
VIPVCGLIERALAEFDLDASALLAGVVVDCAPQGLVPERVSVLAIGAPIWAEAVIGVENLSGGAARPFDPAMTLAAPGSGWAEALFGEEERVSRIRVGVATAQSGERVSVRVVGLFARSAGDR